MTIPSNMSRTTAASRRRSPGQGERGFSLVEALVVCAIVAVSAAVAIPSIAAAMRTSAYRSTVTSTVDRLSRLRAEAARGRQTSFETRNISLEHSSMVVNPPDVEPPDGAQYAEVIVFQGGTGNAFVDGRTRTAAIVVASGDGGGEAFAITVGSASRISAKRKTEKGWEEIAQ